MANLQIKGMEEELHTRIKELAAAENRSVAQEVVFLIREHLAGRSRSSAKTSAELLLELWVHGRMKETPRR